MVLASSPVVSRKSLISSSMALGVMVGAGVGEGRINADDRSPSPGSGVEVGGSGVSVLVALGELVGIGALVGSVVLQPDKRMSSSPTSTKVCISRKS